MYKNKIKGLKYVTKVLRNTTSTINPTRNGPGRRPAFSGDNRTLTTGAMTQREGQIIYCGDQHLSYQ